jgi:hypothetical protein
MNFAKIDFYQHVNSFKNFSRENCIFQFHFRARPDRSWLPQGQLLAALRPYKAGGKPVCNKHNDSMDQRTARPDMW